MDEDEDDTREPGEKPDFNKMRIALPVQHVRPVSIPFVHVWPLTLNLIIHCHVVRDIQDPRLIGSGTGDLEEVLAREKGSEKRPVEDEQRDDGDALEERGGKKAKLE